MTLWNLQDSSMHEYASAVWSISENVECLVGALLDAGSEGEEFGGFSEKQLGVNAHNPNYYFTQIKAYF